MLFNTVLSLSALAVAAALQVNTPATLIECQPAAISFSAGTAPYFVSILPAGQPSGTPLKTFDAVQSSPLTWTVDLPAGTNITVALTDASGSPVYSSAVVIMSGSSTACLADASASASASATGSGSASASGTGSPTSSASSKASASPSGAATKNVLSAGLLGLVGVAIGVAA